MKRFVRIIDAKNEYRQNQLKSYLNALGFYVLLLPNNMLEVNVISDDTCWIDRVFKFMSREVFMNKEKPYEHVFKRCKECGKVTDNIVEALVTTCTNCYVAVDDDGEDIFGEEGFKQ